VVTHQHDGAFRLRAVRELEPYEPRSTARLAYWASAVPDRPLLQWRDGKTVGEVSYSQMFDAARRIGQALLDRGLDDQRPLAILSGNDRDHLTLALAAQHVGVPYAPISPAYSLLSRDFGLLKHLMQALTPGAIFVADAARFGAALSAVNPRDEIIAPAATIAAERSGRAIVPVESLVATAPTAAVDRAHARIGPDTVAKILFTSGSTGHPKGVTTTHRMLCSNQQMIVQMLPFLADEPPYLVDWLPWHHSFGGSHNVGLVLFNGGTLFVDEGRPVPGGFGETIRNLRERSPTIYFNVPRGYEELVGALRRDPRLADTFFRRLAMLFCAAAPLPQHVADALREISRDVRGEPVPLVTGFGATETAPLALGRPWDSDVALAIGLPVAGVAIKLAPVDGKLEVRVTGPNVTPGYWRDPGLTKIRFDEQGFYRTGDAARFIDPADPARGLVFDGRLGEDFKLLTGTWVNVGALRVQLIAHFAPYVRDAVITGEGHAAVGALVVPDVEACRRLVAHDLATGTMTELLRHANVRACFQRLLGDLAAESSGSATRVERLAILEEPPALDAGEITDKGSLNRNAILSRRASLVRELHAEAPPPHIIGLPGV
jgi:feruloyl-CoA synthase